MPLSARLPELSALEVLSAIADTGSLSAAAREVGLTQQAVSARLKSIEAQTGVRLVNRTTRGSTLTPAGVVVAGWTEQLLDAARRLDAGLASMRTAARAHLKVAASLTIAEQLLPRWLVSMQVTAHRRGETAPEVTFTAIPSEAVITAVRDGAADLGFIEIRGATRGLRSRVVARDELVVVVPPEHKWARRISPLTAAELDQTFLVSRRSGWHHLLGDDETAVGAEDSGQDVLEFGSAASVRAAVLAGAGPAVMSRLAVRDDLAEGRLKAVPVADLDWRRDLRAVWVGERTPPAGAARDLLAHIATGR
jgi:molybdate transport repressor ModE-like protein